jgi:hypothetical protein
MYLEDSLHSLGHPVSLLIIGDHVKGTKRLLNWVCVQMERFQSGRGVTLATNLHLVSRLRMSGFILYFSYAFVTCTGKTFPLLCLHNIRDCVLISFGTT